MNSNSTILTHTYTNQGKYEWTVRVDEKVEKGLAGLAVDIITIDGPTVALTSVPFPPLVVLDVDDGTVEFTATAEGGTPDPEYVYAWDLDS